MPWFSKSTFVSSVARRSRLEAELHELVEALTRRARKSLAVAGLVLIKELTLSYHNRIYCGDYSSLSG